MLRRRRKTYKRVLARRPGRPRRVGRPRVTVRRIGRPRRRKQGRGLWDLIKKGHNWIKSNKIISTVGNALGSVIPLAGTIGRTAATMGYGRRRRRRVRRVGGSLRSMLGSLHKFTKDKRLISSALSHFGHPKLSQVASNLGYGRRRIGGSLIDPVGAVRF